MNKPAKPLTDHEKQMMPIPGEITPGDALIKARLFTARERSSLNDRRNKQPPIIPK